MNLRRLDATTVERVDGRDHLGRAARAAAEPLRRRAARPRRSPPTPRRPARCPRRCAAPAATSRTRSSTATTPSTRCSATCAALEAKDLSLTHSMIALGSCTMKLNATSEMEPVTWPQFNALHPFAPARAVEGLRHDLRPAREPTSRRSPASRAARSMPNAGSQGEYAGLLVIRVVPRGARPGPPQGLPDPRVGARHQPRLGGDGRLPGGGGQDRRSRQRRRGRSEGEDRREQGPARRADDHLPLDARRVRGGDHRDLRRSSTRPAVRSTWTAPT